LVNGGRLIVYLALSIELFLKGDNVDVFILKLVLLFPKTKLNYNYKIE